MKKNLSEQINLEQRYRMLIRNLRKQEEKNNNEKANDKKANRNQSK